MGEAEAAVIAIRRARRNAPTDQVSLKLARAAGMARNHDYNKACYGLATAMVLAEAHPRRFVEDVLEAYALVRTCAPSE